MKSTWKYPLAALILAVAALGGCAAVDDGPLSLERGMTEQEMLEAYADSVVASLGTLPENLEFLKEAVWHSLVYPELYKFEYSYRDPEKLPGSEENLK